MADEWIGGTRLANANTQDEVDLGQTIIIVGLAIQIIFFGVFLVAAYIFHTRINRDPTAKSLNSTINWRRMLHVLYVTSVLILIRSIFRVVEYVMGRDGELQSKEAYIYIFDATLMFFVVLIFNIFHPSRFMKPTPKNRLNSSGSSTNIQLGMYEQRASNAV